MIRPKKRTKLPAKSRTQLLKMAVLALVFGVVGQSLLRFSSAANGPTLFVSPSSATVIQNNTFNIEVRLNTAGQEVDGVEAFLTYPADKLQFQSISEAGTAFGIGLPSSGGGGNITIRRLVNPDQNSTVNGSNLLVATVTLKALAGSGSGAVNYTSQSRVTAPSAGTGSVLQDVIGGNYTFSTPPGPVVAPPPTTTTSSPTPSPAAPTPTPPPASTSTTAPKPRTGVSQPAPTGSTSPVAQPSPEATSAPIVPTISEAVIPEEPDILAALRTNQSAILAAKLFGGLLLLGCLAMLIKLLHTWHSHTLIPNTGIGHVQQHAFVGGQNHSKHGEIPLTMSPTQRVPQTPPPENYNTKDITPE